MNNLNFLLVGTNLSFQWAVTEHLSRLGYSNFFKVNTSEESFNHIKNNQVDVIIGHYSEGLALFKNINKHIRYMRIPFILGLKNEDDVFKHGVYSILWKDFSTDDLKREINKVQSLVS